MSENKIYICIDLKSFYASVECVERNNKIDFEDIYDIQGGCW